MVLLAAVLAAILYVCCYKGKMIEGMTAGFGTITGLSFNNKNLSCYSGNSTGSSSPYCEDNGYVLV